MNKKDPEKNPYAFGHQFSIEKPDIHTGKKIVYSVNGAGQAGWLHEESKQIHTYYSAKNSSPNGSKTSK